MKTATSADGTTIAYDTWGKGPLVVLVGGAFSTRQAGEELAQVFAEDFKAVTYDRRGRGDSGDTQPYALERELEDLTAIIAAESPDGTAFAHGNSSGGALVLQAVAAGLPIEKASVFEPPYRVEGSPPLPDDYVRRLDEFIAADRREEAVVFFNVEAVGIPAEMVEQMKQDPMWAGLEAIAHTLAYDGHALGGNDHSLPSSLLATVDIPVLAISSSGTVPWLKSSARATAEAIPNGRHEELEGGFHQVAAPLLVPTLTKFYGESE
ncbi:MAG: hypothetical protein QOH26_2293 [Actinomycetota bacterium]|nr:hypothetical protein [Actinomycetota bacterium]